MPIPFRPLARMLARTRHPSPVVDLSLVEGQLAQMAMPGARQGVLITMNHYTASDHPVWWSVILVSALFPREVHWVVTSGWTGASWRDRFTHWLFPFGARMLGFTAMPAMPPDPSQVEQRAQAVRQVLGYARRSRWAVVGLTPEGGDSPGGVLGELPAGAGRFMEQISRYCPYVLPVGVWSEEGVIQVKFGSPYTLNVEEGLTSEERDARVGELVMGRIAECLPARLRGKYEAALSDEP